MLTKEAKPPLNPLTQIGLKQRNVKHIRIDEVKTLYEIYEFQETIGHGTYGTVVSVVERDTHINFAIKIVNKFTAGVKNQVEIQREFNILKTVNHPNIIVLHKIYESNKKFYMIFEKCGDNLFNVYKQKFPFSEKNNKKIIEQLVAAVYYLHKNDIVHRDIKMDNILLAKNPNDPNDEFYIKLSDFGLSIIKSGAGIRSMLTERCGTVIYMAPEILLQRNYSELCDVWSVGIILYVLLIGRFPFYEIKQDDLVHKILNTEPEINPNIVSHDATDLLKCILKKDPVNRITALEILKHPWLLDNKMKSRKDETIIDYMKKWRSELILPGEESDWMSSYAEQSEFSIFPQSVKNMNMAEKETSASTVSSFRSMTPSVRKISTQMMTNSSGTEKQQD